MSGTCSWTSCRGTESWQHIRCCGGTVEETLGRRDGRLLEKEVGLAVGVVVDELTGTAGTAVGAVDGVTVEVAVGRSVGDVLGDGVGTR